MLRVHIDLSLNQRLPAQKDGSSLAVLQWHDARRSFAEGSEHHASGGSRCRREIQTISALIEKQDGPCFRSGQVSRPRKYLGQQVIEVEFSAQLASALDQGCEVGVG